LAEGEDTIAFVSSIPFRFAIQSTVSWSFPSNPLCLLFLCMYCSSRSPPSADHRPCHPDSAASFIPAAGEHLPSISSSYSWPHLCSSLPETLAPPTPGTPCTHARMPWPGE
jgi:hypothetical protein